MSDGPLSSGDQPGSPRGAQRTWWIYLLDCDGRLYTGITTDPDRRLREHRSGKSRSARFTRGAKSIELHYSVALGDRSLALRAEYRLKRLPRAKKLKLCQHSPSAAALLEQLALGS
ncbi:MAG: GIY-YIG nuclease family protein [Pseudomonadota bacterium]